jgi:hypothetical protein
VRLVVLLVIALAGGIFIASQLTSDRTKGWVSESVFGATLQTATGDGGVSQPEAGEAE